MPTTKNKVNRWSLELTTYNITFEWISGAKNKAANHLSWLVEQPMTIPATVSMLTVTHTHRPASNTRSQTKKDSPDTTSTPHPDVSPSISPDATQTPKPLTADRLEALLQIQRTDPFCRHTSKHLFNSKVPQQNRCFYSCKGITVLTCYGLWKTIPCPCYPQILEVYGFGESSQQTRTSRKLLHLLSNKKTILLEGYEQRY